MKRCPTCNKTYTDQNLSFCTDDGTPLVPITPATDETTVVTPSPDQRGGNQPAPGAYVPRDWQAPDYQPPGSSVSPGRPTKRKVWPWVVGILAVAFIGIVGLGIVAAILIPNMMRAASKRNRATANANIQRSDRDSSNLNSNTPAPNSNLDNLNENTGAAPDEDATSAPPNDKTKVLADLRDLENEWTAANINADKQKLDKILADDYVGQTSNGKVQGKADYLKTIERDTAIQEWDFEDLKVDLKGDRAALSGIIRLKLADKEVAYNFTDKFVWRDGRWQAVGSEVSLIEQ